MANITTQTIRVDLSTGKVIPTAYTHQNDTARTLVFDMYNGGLPYTMTGNTVKFAYKSPVVDGQYTVIAGSSMASGTVSGNKVTVALPVAYTRISGVGLLTMIITPSSGTIRPVNVRFVVQKSADGDDVVAGASDLPSQIDTIINDAVETAVTQADNEIKGDFYETHLRDHSILYDLPWGNYAQKGNNTEGYVTNSNTMTFGMSEFRYASKSIVIKSNGHAAEAGITIAVRIYQKDGDIYKDPISVTGFFDSNESDKPCAILAGMYYWIGFRDGNDPHQLTKDKLAEYFDIFETTAPYVFGATHTGRCYQGGYGAMSNGSQYADEEMLVTCDDWKRYHVTYAEYASGSPYEILTSARYASTRGR